MQSTDEEAQDRLEGLLFEGIATGDASELTDHYWEEIRSEALQGFEARRSNR